MALPRDIALLHPTAQRLCRALIAECAGQGLPIAISSTWRSKADQDALYAQGRTAAGSIVTNCRYPDSPHNWGVAFDFYREEKGRTYDNSDGFFRKVGAVGRSMGGLTWGGDWKKFVDMPHFEVTEFMPNASASMLKKTYGTPEAFKATWPEVTEEEEDTMTTEKRYNTVDELPTWAKPTIEKVIRKGILRGDGAGYDLSLDMVRMFVFNDRAGVYDHLPDVVGM